MDGRRPDFVRRVLAQVVQLPRQYYDAETGLHYNRFRYYDPSIGRYISADPIGQAGLLDEASVALVGIPASPIDLRNGVIEPAGWDYNLYGYTLNNPVNFSDSTGLSTDRYVPDNSGKHGGPHVDRYNKAGQNVGRYRPDGSPMDHKGKPSPSVPKSDKKKLKKALDKLKFGAIPAASTFDAFCLRNPVECNQLFGEPLPPSPKEDCTEEQ